jgi:hypothetical protein
VVGLFVVERVGGCGSGCRWVEISGDGDHGNLGVQFALTHGFRGWESLGGMNRYRPGGSSTTTGAVGPPVSDKA